MGVSDLTARKKNGRGRKAEHSTLYDQPLIHKSLTTALGSFLGVGPIPQVEFFDKSKASAKHSILER
jgi:hypothetical protein